jgi:hypothetical protein
MYLEAGTLHLAAPEFLLLLFGKFFCKNKMWILLFILNV